MSRCPPGVLCIENFTLVIAIAIAVCVIIFVQYQNNRILVHSQKQNFYSNKSDDDNVQVPSRSGGLFSRFNFAFSDKPNDVLLNPYEAPLRDDRIFQGGIPSRHTGDVRGVPINIATQSVDTNYRQVGILTRLNGAEMILPLLGRPLLTNRDKWNFYTMSDKNNIVKLPVTHKGKSCTNEYGCDNLYNGDTVYVEGYNDAFKVTMYDNQVMKYIPFL